MHWGWSDPIYVVLLCVGLGCAVIVACRRGLWAITGRSWPGSATELKAALGALLRRGAGPDDGDLRRHLEERMVAKRVCYTRAFVSCAAFFLSLIAVSILLGVVGRRPRWMGFVQEVIFVFGYALAIFAQLIPRRHFTARSVKFYYSLCMLLLTAFMSPWAMKGRDQLILMIPSSSMASILMGIMNLDFPMGFFWNAIYTVITIWAYSHCSGSLEAASVSDFAQNEVMLFLQKMVVLYAFQSSMAAGVRRELEATSERSLRSALTSLLGLVCDAVVELDSKLVIVEHAPALTHTLMHGMGRSLQGSTLQQFIPEEADRDLFERSLCSADGCLSPEATVFHARVRDSMGNRIAMEFFHVPFANYDGRTHHLLGLREDVDFQKYASVSGNLVAIEEAGNNTTAGSAASAESPAGAGAGGGRTLRRAGTAGSSGSDDLSGDVKGMQVDFRVVQSFPITFSSAEFKAKYGETEGTGLLEWLQDGKAFGEWVTAKTDAIFKGVQRPMIDEFGPLALSAPAREAPCSSVPVPQRLGSRMAMVQFPDPWRHGENGKFIVSRGFYQASVLLGKRQSFRGGQLARSSSGLSEQQPIADTDGAN